MFEFVQCHRLFEFADDDCSSPLRGTRSELGLHLAVINGISKNCITESGIKEAGITTNRITARERNEITQVALCNRMIRYRMCRQPSKVDARQIITDHPHCTAIRMLFLKLCISQTHITIIHHFALLLFALTSLQGLRWPFLLPYSFVFLHF